MATAPTKIKSSSGQLSGPYYVKTADTVDGYLYREDPTDRGYLVVATTNSVGAGVPVRRAKVGELVEIRTTGHMPVIASGVVALGAAVTCDTVGKVKTGTVGTDHIIGVSRSVDCTADGDVITIEKFA